MFEHIFSYFIENDHYFFIHILFFYMDYFLMMENIYTPYFKNCIFKITLSTKIRDF